MRNSNNVGILLCVYLSKQQAKNSFKYNEGTDTDVCLKCFMKT